MFALRRSSLRLATSVPLLRPSRLQVAFSRASPNTFQSTPTNNSSPDLRHLISDLGVDVGLDEPSVEQPELSDKPTLVQDSPNPFAEPVPPTPAAFRVHCFSSRTNTINTFTDPDGNVIAWNSGGSCGFKKRNRSTYEAGYQCAVRLFEKISAKAQQESTPLTIDLFFKGFGLGRDALTKALTTAEGDDVRTRIVSVTDRTPIKIGGTRAKKRKRR
jgi:small subunit ribosomal protein S11